MRYLDLVRTAREISEISEISGSGTQPPGDTLALSRARRGLNSLNSLFSQFEARCPDLVDPADWQQAVEDGRAFVAQWGDQALALGWTPRDLFGLHQIPDKPAPSYRRLSRYDETGLIWLLHGRPVVALTAGTAAIQGSNGNLTVYRRHNKPGLGPLGDSLDDAELWGQR